MLPALLCPRTWESKRAASPQACGQFSPECAAALHVERLVD